MIFTPTQLKVVNHIKHGRSNIQAAARMKISIPEYKAIKDEVRLIMSGLQEPKTPVIPTSVDKPGFDGVEFKLKFDNTPICETLIEETVFSDEIKGKPGLNVPTAKIVENSTDVEKGTKLMKGIMSYEPMSDNEVEVAFKIDLDRWRLAAYWNKAQPNGTYLVSANVVQKKALEISLKEVTSAITNVFSNTDITPVIFAKQQSNGKALFVYSSDKHVGAYVGTTALYENNYDEMTFAARMSRLLFEIIYLESIYGHFEDIFIIDLGDSLDGQDAMTTRKGHSLPQNMTNKEAFEVYLKVHKDFFDNLHQLQLANTIHFIAATNDNHAGDFGYFTNRALEEYLKVKYPESTTRILTKFIEHLVYGEHTLILTHGKDDVDMKHGWPLILSDKIQNMVSRYMRMNKIDPFKTTVHLRKGDLHQYANQQSADFDYKNVLSMFGSSKWIMHNVVGGHAGVSMDVIEKDTYRVFEANLLYK